jgi:hypothetical protein
VTLPGEMLAAYRLQEVEIQLLRPGSLGPAALGLRSFRVRWRPEGA